MVEMIEGNVANTEEVSASSDELENMARQLNQLVGEFDLKNR
ncbi:hypothetical protein [Halarsenatibacter silvermanii]|uniref:Methyl-accepting chemotaxis protein n=1 Tax=Halarsenatibacter silvermanii TaxID=321763 RepID=A0A1G9TII3_9FIRM|nr:hypothetical protein [Halarsenatibacter silvermanii]SDM47460.1 hypothetical protein SAMN04488692_1408 [Halarsenatibacter silvermanii]